MQGITKPAILYKDIITQEMNKKLYTEDWFYYSDNSVMPFTFPTDTKNEVHLAILDPHETVVGYLSYHINFYYSCINSFGLMGFVEKSPYIGAGLIMVMEQLINQFHRIEWMMIGGNPVERHYDKFIEKYNGNKNTLHDAIKDNYGKYRNVYVYEIINKNIK